VYEKCYAHSRKQISRLMRCMRKHREKAAKEMRQ
jgi:hypothetical protein